MYLGIPENIVPITLKASTTTNTSVTTAYIPLKDVHQLVAIFQLKQAVGHATGIDPVQATAEDGTGSKAITNAVQIWANEDASTAGTFPVPKDDALTYNVTNDVKDKIVIMTIDPAGLDVANGFDCIGFTLDASSQATNFVSAMAFTTRRYQVV